MILKDISDDTILIIKLCSSTAINLLFNNHLYMTNMIIIPIAMELLFTVMSKG